MSFIGDLAASYERQVALPWRPQLSPSERVWIAVYPPGQERRLRAHLGDFENRTKQYGHGWRQVDLTDSFGHWLGTHPYRDAYVEDPEALTDSALDGFAEYVVGQLEQSLTAPTTTEESVVAVIGTGSLFPFVRASRVIERAATTIRGRLLVFFPGYHQDANYRLLDARDGWNYHAITITVSEDRT